MSKLLYVPDLRVVQNPGAYWNPEEAIPGMFDLWGNPIFAGAWVLHSCDRQRLQLTQVASVTAPLRPDVQAAVVKVRTPRQSGTWWAPGPYEQGPLRTVASYAVARYLGLLPEHLAHLNDEMEGLQ